MNDKDKPVANKNTNDNTAPKKTMAEKKTAPAAHDEKKEARSPTLSSRVLLILLIFIAGMGLSIYLMPTLSERLPFVANWIGSEEAGEIATLSQRIEAQQQQISALELKTRELENTLGSLPADGGEPLQTSLEGRIAALEALTSSAATDQTETAATATDTSQSARIDLLLSRMSQLEASFVPLSKNMLDAGQAELEREQLASDTASMSEKLADLENRLSNVEQIATKDNSGILLNLKIADLKRSFDRGNPYSAEILAIEQIINSSSLAEDVNATNALTTLSQDSATGMITIEKSVLNFSSLIPDMLKEEGKDQDATWMQNTWSSIKNLITVRQTNGAAPTASDLDNQIARIETYLLQRNPEAAANAVDALPDQVKVVLETWRAELQSFIDGSNAIIMLERLATENYLLEENKASTQPETSL